MKILPFILSVALALSAGCATSTPEKTIPVYREGTKPRALYTEIGLISREDFAGEEANAIKDLQNQARDRGADGIILLEGRSTGYHFNMFGRSDNRYLWRAVMIKLEDWQYTDPPHTDSFGGIQVTNIHEHVKP